MPGRDRRVLGGRDTEKRIGPDPSNDKGNQSIWERFAQWKVLFPPSAVWSQGSVRGQEYNLWPHASEEWDNSPISTEKQISSVKKHTLKFEFFIQLYRQTFKIFFFFVGNYSHKVLFFTGEWSEGIVKLIFFLQLAGTLQWGCINMENHSNTTHPL